MSNEVRIDEEKRLAQLKKTNPLFGDTPLKLGTFCSNVSGGASMSKADGMLDLTWASTSHLAKLTDEMKFEAIVPIGRWRGVGGETDPCRDCFESMTFAAGMGAQTKHPSVFATVHVPTLHPVMAAKQATTIDHISGGRFTMNIVAGWNEGEMALFGGKMLPHDERYTFAAEWITLMKKLWTAQEPLDFDGKYFHLKDAFLRPQPIATYPALMSAGASPAGRAFAAEHCDIAFTAFNERDPKSMRERLDSYHDVARKRFGRKIKIWINAYMFIGDTQQDAQAQFDDVIVRQGDYAAADNVCKMMKIGGAETFSDEALAALKREFMAGWAGYQLIGTKEKIVDDLKTLVEGGVDGILLNWPKYIEGMERFKNEVHPLLVQEGLR